MLINCQNVVQNSTAKIINSIGSKSLWMTLRFTQDGFSGQSLFIILTLKLRLMVPMHWLVLEEFG